MRKDFEFSHDWWTHDVQRHAHKSSQWQLFIASLIEKKKGKKLNYEFTNYKSLQDSSKTSSQKVLEIFYNGGRKF